MLLTTQYLEEADSLANRIAVIDHGHKVAEGTAAELKAGLGATIVEIGFGDAGATNQAEGTLAPIGSTSILPDGRTVRVNANDGARAVLDVARLLDDAQLIPSDFTVREPTLDDVFLSLTGHAAEPDDTTEGEPSSGDGQAGRRRRPSRSSRGAA